MREIKMVMLSFLLIVRANNLREMLNILVNVHEHSFSSIISKLFSNCHRIWLRSYIGLGSSVYFLPTQSSHLLGWPLTFSLQHYTLDWASPTS
jgi:hypothetical protein